MTKMENHYSEKRGYKVRFLPQKGGKKEGKGDANWVQQGLGVPKCTTGIQGWGGIHGGRMELGFREELVSPAGPPVPPRGTFLPRHRW